MLDTMSELYYLSIRPTASTNTFENQTREQEEVLFPLLYVSLKHLCASVGEKHPLILCLSWALPIKITSLLA